MTKNTYLPPNEPYPYRDDEIDLAELVENIWNTRWRALIAVLLALLLYGAYLSVGVITADTPQTYRQIVELNFDGLQDGEYPNGSPFVMSSMLSQTVVRRVHERNELDQFDISVGDLREALLVEPYNAEFSMTQARYEQRLASGDLSSGEIAELEEAMRRELSVEGAGGVRISLQLGPDVELDAASAERILKDVPRVWADRAIVEEGVLDLNRAIYSAEIFAESQYSRLDYPVAIDLLQENIELMRADIDALRERPQADNARDPETGLRLIDLDKRLQDILRYEAAEVINPVRELGLTREPERAMLYLERQLREVRLEQRFWEERARITRALISGDEPVGQALGNGGSASGEGMNLTAQIDGSFLDQLMDIARQGNSEAFRQSLVRQILEYEETALTQAQEAERIERSFEAIRESGESVTEEVQDYRELFETRLPEVLKRLQANAGALQRIADAMSEQASGNISELAVPSGGSFEIAHASVLPRRALLIGVALAFLVGFATMVLALLSDALKRRRSSDGSSEGTAVSTET